MKTYPEIYYSDDVKRILNSKPPLPDAPKAPEYIAEPQLPTMLNFNYLRIFFWILFIISIVSFIVGFFINQEKNIISVCSLFCSIILYIIARFLNQKVEDYKWAHFQYKQNIELRKIYKSKYADYVEDTKKYEGNVKTILSDENIDRFRKNQINTFLTKRDTPKLVDYDGDNVKKGISELLFATLLSKEFTVYTNQKVRIVKGYYYPDIILVHKNIFIDIEIDEPYSNDDRTPIHYISNRNNVTVDDDRNEFFTKQGFEVIRFAEEQIIKYPIECIIVIKNVISKIERINSKIAIQRDFYVNKWTKAEAYNMAVTSFRESYITDVNIWNIKVSTTKNEIGELFAEMAEDGDSTAQFNVAMLYYYGVQGVKKNYKRMVDWYIKSAAQGNIRAQVNLGDCYFNGVGVSQDFERAVDWYMKSANQGSAKAQFKLGNCYYDGKGVSLDYVIAVNYFEKSATQNNPNAMYKLGYCYYYGKGVTQDEDYAVSLYQKASDLGHREAQLMLGLYYYRYSNYKDAVRLFKKLAEIGNATAMFYLGECYHKSRGVSQNSFLAVSWYEYAAEAGNENALLCLADCYFIGDGVQKDKNKTIEYWTKAADKGNIKAQLNLAFFYSDKKEGIYYDNEKAVKWFTQAAELGNAEAQYKLGRCYYEGKGIVQDYEKAVEWYTKAAEQRHSEARKCLSICYHGEGVSNDVQKSFDDRLL